MKRISHLLAICGCAVLVWHWSGMVRAEQTEGDAAADVRIGTVTSNVLNVRARPATHYEVVCQLKRGDEVSIVGQNEQWFELRAPHHAKAYIAERFLGPDDRVNADRVRVYAGPGIVFTTFAHVNEGQVVKRIGAPVKEWQQIEPPPDATVWASQAFIEVRQPPEPEALVDVAGDAETVVARIETAADVPDAVPEDKDLELPPPAKAGASPHAEAVAELILPPLIVDEAPMVAVEAPDGLLPPVTAALPGEDVDAALEQQGAEVPLPAAPVLPDTSAEVIVKADPVSHTGVVFALSQPIANVATHLLTLRIEYTCYPICYLHSDKIDLAEWELRQVRVEGKEVWYRGWQRPVIDVTGIQLDR